MDAVLLWVGLAVALSGAALVAALGAVFPTAAVVGVLELAYAMCMLLAVVELVMFARGVTGWKARRQRGYERGSTCSRSACW